MLLGEGGGLGFFLIFFFFQAMLFTAPVTVKEVVTIFVIYLNKHPF